MGLMPLVNRRLSTPVLPRNTPPPVNAPVRMPAVGLLGGSFNPAHAGHRQISLEALRRLGLDEIWWLVSPQNPLKSRASMAPFEERMRSARDVADHPKIKPSALEARLGSNLTYQTLERLQRFQDRRFIFMIGADNLVQLSRWHHWHQIMHAVPIAVFDRSPYSYGAIASKAARCYEHCRLPEARAIELKGMTAPVWTYIHIRAHPASSTAIRANHGGWWQGSE